jgi:probable F420-dependent oxidoreductase
MPLFEAGGGRDSLTLRIFATLSGPLARVGAQAAQCESLGFDGVITQETAHDPFLPLALAAEHTTKLQLMTAIAVAFARSPMTLAHVAHDLNSFSSGRFILGLGSQVKAHIERRFSMPWSHPAARMREMVQAILAIFAAWYDGQKLAFEGQFYRHTLTSPTFTPKDTRAGKPAIFVAAVGPQMTETAGAVADGLIIHPLTTESYLRKVTLPHLHRGLQSAGRPSTACRTCLAPFIVTGRNEEELARARRLTADRIAFYASTPAYRPVLEQQGWGELQSQLHALTRQGRWSELGSLITDEVLQQFAVVGTAAEIAPNIWERFGDVITDFSLTAEYLDTEALSDIARDLRRLSARTAS